MSPDEDLLKNVEDLAKPKKSKTKAEKIIENLKENIITTNPELRQAYFDWIDAVYSKVGWMSKKAVEVGERLVDENSNHNLDIALKIVEIATVNGYKDMTWAVDLFKKNYQPTYAIKPVNVPQERATGFGSEVF